MVASSPTSFQGAPIDGHVLAKKVAIAYSTVAGLSAVALRVVFGGTSGWFTWPSVKGLALSAVIIGVSAFAMYHLVRRGVQRLVDAHQSVVSVQREILQQLSMAAKFRDGATSSHTLRVGLYAEAIALELGIDPDNAALLREAAELHDIGKLGIPDSVLQKAGQLDLNERQTMQRHVIIGAELLSSANSPTMNLAKTIVVAHHERWDGKGYPNRLSTEQIPLEARIVAVADVFDALTSQRSYKNAWTVDEAIAEIRRSSGTQFDPHVVEAFSRALPKMRYLLTFGEHGPDSLPKAA